MTALIVNLFEIIGSLLKTNSNKSHDQSFQSNRSESSRRHSRHLVRPALFHQQLPDSFVDQFDEVLVIGDVHGCFDELIKLLQLAADTGSSAPQTSSDDRSRTKSALECASDSAKAVANRSILKIFVGDLINKGPKSKHVIDYMRERPNECLSVRGNHEEISIKAYFAHQAKNGSDEVSGTSVADNAHPTRPSMSKKHSRAEQEAVELDDIQMDKYDWARELDPDQIAYLISLPYTISIPALNAIIVHAGLVAGLPLSQHDPYDLVHMRNYVFEDYFDGAGIRALKTDDQGEPWAPLWPGPQHVYFGHNSKRGLQQCPHATGLDTGCVVGGRLTGVFIKGPRTGQFLSVNSQQAYKKKKKSKKGNDSNSS